MEDIHSRSLTKLRLSEVFAIGDRLKSSLPHCKAGLNKSWSPEALASEEREAPVQTDGQIASFGKESVERAGLISSQSTRCLSQYTHSSSTAKAELLVYVPYFLFWTGSFSTLFVILAHWLKSFFTEDIVNVFRSCLVLCIVWKCWKWGRGLHQWTVSNGLCWRRCQATIVYSGPGLPVSEAESTRQLTHNTQCSAQSSPVLHI